MKQSTDTLLMVRPVKFDYNAQTAVNNYFQSSDIHDNISEKAIKEFDRFAEKLNQSGVNIVIIEDTIEPHTPDSIFPNNWFSTHSDGTLVLYPMYAENRRWERREDVIQLLNEKFELNRTIDFTAYENQGKFLEGTGSIILDHINQMAYAAVSERTHPELFQKFCSELGFEPVVFHAFQSVGEQRLPIYHTNVMMCLATNFAVICLSAIDDLSERERVIEKITSSGKKIIEISEEQMHQFAGNMLEVRNTSGELFLVMSESAFKSLTSEQIEHIQQTNKILYSDISTIEKYGGGSARCMLAEVFLPKK